MYRELGREGTRGGAKSTSTDGGEKGLGGDESKVGGRFEITSARIHWGKGGKSQSRQTLSCIKAKNPQPSHPTKPIGGSYIELMKPVSGTGLGSK